VSRRVPEAALAVGVLLSVTFVAFVALTRGGRSLAGTEPLATLGVAVALLYPFAVWSVYHSDDPTWALPPRTVAVVASTVAVAALAVGVVRGAALLGVSVALLTVLPPLAYWLTAADAPAVGPRPALGVASAGALAVVVLGVVVEGPLLAAVDALAVFLPAVAYYVRAGGGRLSTVTTLGLGGVAAGVVVLTATVVAASTYATLAGVTTVALGTMLAAYATALRSA